jgi:hypothetical protein
MNLKYCGGSLITLWPPKLLIITLVVQISTWTCNDDDTFRVPLQDQLVKHLELKAVVTHVVTSQEMTSPKNRKSMLLMN